jgi:hypothetical protein
MALRGPFAEAEPGSLPRQVLIDLILMRDFLDARQRAFYALFGRPLKHSALRDELIRSCVIEFGLGRSHRISYYQHHCAAFGSASAVLREVHTLKGLRVLVTKQDPENLTALLVLPTARLIDFSANKMTSLVDDITLIFLRRSQMSD